MFSNLTQQYHDKMVKKSARKGKRNQLEKRAELAEEAKRRGDSKTVYCLTNEIVGKCQSMKGPVRDPNGGLATDSEDVSKVWAYHFQTLLNRPPPLELPTIPDIPLLSLPINVDPQISQRFVWR